MKNICHKQKQSLNTKTWSSILEASPTSSGHLKNSPNIMGLS